MPPVVENARKPLRSSARPGEPRPAQRVGARSAALLQRATLVALVLLYLGISLPDLARVPPLHEDESWQASTGWKIATAGVFGSDMFAGFHDAERRYYGFMPIHPLIEGLVFRIAGLGVLQIRAISVAMGLLTLLLTYSLGRRLFAPSVGVLAVAFLLCVRLTGLSRSQTTGILLVDVARIGRYDIVVPVFGLSALYAYLVGSARRALRWYALAGLLAGLSALSHVYGAFWLVALVLLAVWDGTDRRSLLALGLGFAAPLALYLAYVLSDLPAWTGQNRVYAPRFELLNPRWYWSNLLSERQRYATGLGAAGWQYLLRPGLWATLLLLPASLAGLALRAVRRGDAAARAVLVPTLAFPLLFALLITLKLANYAVTVLPMAALAVAWGAISLWRWAGPQGAAAQYGRRFPALVRAGLIALLLVVAVEGAARIAAIDAAAATATPYSTYMQRVRAAIPAGSRVIGLPYYWLGLHDFDYRTWLVPIFLSDPAHSVPPLAVGDGLDRIAPDVLLIDARLRDYFDSAPATDPVPPAILGWIERRHFTRIATVDDRTYGTMEIYSSRASR